MSSVATAIIGSAVLGAGASIYAGKKSGDALERGADTSAAAIVESTRLQVEEMQRQFDYQIAILQPMLQQQYNAQGAYGDLLGITAQNPQGTPATQTPGTSVVPQNFIQPGGEVRPGAGQQQIPGGTAQPGGPSGPVPGGQQFIGGSQTNRPENKDVSDLYRNIFGREPDASGLKDWTALWDKNGRTPEFLDQIANAFRNSEEYGKRKSRGVLPPSESPGGGGTPQTFGRDNTTNFARDESGAFIDPNRDPSQLLDFVQENPLATDQYQDDPRFDFARDTAITGDVFEEGPGYNYMVEQMRRELDREDSAGGNFGGRAIMEGMRRSKGLAATEYYNWANLRSGDLLRQDYSLEGWQNRKNTDVQRGDVARQYDVARKDEGYQNYLDNLARASGFGNPAGSAVNASSNFALGVSGAYGSEGANLSGIYGNLGRDRADNSYRTAANVSGAIQGGASNYLFNRYLNPPTPPPLK